MSRSSAPATPLSPTYVHNVGGSDRRQVGQPGGELETTGGANDPQEHYDAGQEEEAQPQRLVKTPYTPTKAEMAEHRAPMCS